MGNICLLIRGLACFCLFGITSATFAFAGIVPRMSGFSTHIVTNILQYMKTIIERFYSAMENQLAEITLSGEPLTEQYRSTIKVCKKAMTKLKNYVSSYAFESVAEEVNFFKLVKPQFYSKYIYFINIHNYLLQKPTGGENIQRALWLL